MNRLAELRNFSVTVAAIIAVLFLFYGLGDGHMKNGLIAQFIAGILTVAVSAAVGAYTHRKIWPDIRPHLFKMKGQQSEEDDENTTYVASSTDSIKYKIYASTHRLVWIVVIMFSMMWFLGNSGIV